MILVLQTKLENTKKKVYTFHQRKINDHFLRWNLTWESGTTPIHKAEDNATAKLIWCWPNAMNKTYTQRVDVCDFCAVSTRNIVYL